MNGHNLAGSGRTVEENEFADEPGARNSMPATGDGREFREN
jgi:hypothetical protein